MLVVTVTSTVPLPAGAVAVSWLVDCSVTAVAATLPKATAAPLAKFVPVIVTVVPPAAGPAAGLTPVTVGCSGLT